MSGLVDRFDEELRGYPRYRGFDGGGYPRSGGFDGGPPRARGSDLSERIGSYARASSTSVRPPVPPYFRGYPSEDSYMSSLLSQGLTLDSGDGPRTSERDRYDYPRSLSSISRYHGVDISTPLRGSRSFHHNEPAARLASSISGNRGCERQGRRHENGADIVQDVRSSRPLGHPRSSDRETIFLFDWDDTLFCSTAINQSRFQSMQLQQLEKSIENILVCAMNFGEVHIVTNASIAWVQDSTLRYVPQASKLLSKINIVSARESFERWYPGDPTAWKRHAFRDILAERRKGCNTGLNLIAIGDSDAEIDAAQNAVHGLREPSTVKTVKFLKSPTLNDVLGQQRLITQELRQIAGEQQSSNRCLMPQSLPGHLEYLRSWASGWTLADPRTYAST